MFTLRPLVTTLALASVLAMAGCNNLTFPQREAPTKAYKEYRPENANQSAVIGVGDPISMRQAAANATLTMSGAYDLSAVMQRVAGTYNLAVRWGSGVRRDKRAEIVLNSLTFDEARNYIEDVYGIQIIKEGERRLLVLPSASEPRLAEFAPGTNVTLAEALRGLADQCNYNLILNENRDQLATIKVSTKLKDITCQDAFDALLNPQGLSLVNSGDYVTVGGLPQRQWSVSLFEPVRSEEVSVNYSSNFGADAGSSGDSGGSSGSMTSGGASKVSIKYERNLWKDMEDDLNKLLESTCTQGLTAEATSASSSSGGSDLLLPPTDGSATPPDSSVVQAPVTAPSSMTETTSTSGESGIADPKRCGYVRVNTAVGTVQMRAARAVLDQADDIIRRTETIANRRLLLEARVLAVTRDRGYEQKGGFAQGRLNSDGNSVAFGSPGSIASTLSRSLANFGQNAAGTSLPGFSFKNANLDAVVSFMEKYSTTYQLMHPVMELMDRQRATLIDGTNQKYFVVNTTVTTDTNTTTTADVEERNQFLGLQFSAAAQISDDPSEPHTISLQIPITSKTGEINIPTGISGTIAGVAPIANTRLIDQKVRIRDGEIKAIGGLTMTVATDKESGMPVLRDIPIMGKLANDENIDYQQVEFVILLQVKRLN
jgi:hypothetical protein